LNLRSSAKEGVAVGEHAVTATLIQTAGATAAAIAVISKKRNLSTIRRFSETSVKKLELLESLPLIRLTN
jgi:hypothetical protein